MYESIDVDTQRKLYADSPSKTPFAHQTEAFAALNQVFQLGKNKSASGMLVLPTGAGKTFTAVRWLCNHALPKKIKILWLAPSYYLLDQAAATFKENIREIPDREKINIRCVSSSKSHANASSIQSSDDVILMTTQTAIINLHSTAKDKTNENITTALRKFIDDNQNSEFFVVVDEAHHTPAYGLRNLLIGKQESNLGLRSLLPNLYLLGLTATPTYSDKAKKGWLSKIFTDGKQGIIYQADKEKLMMQGILARPNYTEISTGTEVELDDALYEELTNKHKDLPEKIIEFLADNQDRNNAIVNTYLADKERYGKTIIFADRWFQCV
ncbi:MAG: DEAD/DEAH box helicase, partial [Pseudanabaena sp.]